MARDVVARHLRLLGKPRPVAERRCPECPDEEGQLCPEFAQALRVLLL